jgi:DNA-binding CsgD family transcriptional regulator
MCPGHEVLEGPHLCGLAEQLFASLPWPCLVWGPEGSGTVMVNDAFRQAFGVGASRAGPRWLAAHRDPCGVDGDIAFTHPRGTVSRYRLTRQCVDTPAGVLEAAFLTELTGPVVATAGVAPAGPSPDDIPTFANLRPDVSLTPREAQVLQGIMEGKLNKMIAGELGISPKTVELHRANLMAKLRVHNVVELTRAVLDASPALA